MSWLENFLDWKTFHQLGATATCIQTLVHLRPHRLAYMYMQLSQNVMIRKLPKLKNSPAWSKNLYHYWAYLYQHDNIYVNDITVTKVFFITFYKQKRFRIKSLWQQQISVHSNVMSTTQREHWMTACFNTKGSVSRQTGGRNATSVLKLAHKQHIRAGNKYTASTVLNKPTTHPLSVCRQQPWSRLSDSSFG